MPDGTTTVTLSDGTKLVVKLLGGDAESKPLLVALHGGPGLFDHTEAEISFAFLASQFRILVYDARGSGASDQRGPYTHKQWIDDLDELRIWAGAKEMVLVGSSYGGNVALEYAIAHIDHVSALIISGTWAHGLTAVLTSLARTVTSGRTKPNIDRQVRVWSGTLHDNMDFGEALMEVMPLYTHDIKAPAESSHSSPPQLKLNYEAQNFAFSQNQPIYDVRSKLKTITVPTLVAIGRQDAMVPFECSMEIRNGIPNAELAIFEHSGHSPATEEVEMFREVVHNFLGRALAI